MASSPDPLVAQLRPLLIQVAGARATITYLELAERAQLPPPHRIHRLTLALEALIEQDHQAGRPLLGALAVGRGTERIPGRGFFELLTRLGRHDGADRGPAAIAAHQREKAAAWDFWGETPAA